MRHSTVLGMFDIFELGLSAPEEDALKTLFI
jgi:hypothetical protein